MLSVPLFWWVDGSPNVKTFLSRLIIRILFLESSFLQNRGIKLNDVDIAGRTIVAGSDAILPAAKDLKSRRVGRGTGVDVDGPMFHPEVGVLAKFPPDGSDGGVVDTPDGKAFFSVGPVLGDGIDLNKQRRVVRSALIEAGP